MQTLEYGLLREPFVFPFEKSYPGKGDVKNFGGALAAHTAEADIEQSKLGLTDNSTPEPHSAMLNPV